MIKRQKVWGLMNMVVRQPWIVGLGNNIPSTPLSDGGDTKRDEGTRVTNKIFLSKNNTKSVCCNT